MLLVQLFDQGIWFGQELVHKEDLKVLEDEYAKQGYELLYERVWPLQTSGAVRCLIPPENTAVAYS